MWWTLIPGFFKQVPWKLVGIGILLTGLTYGGYKVYNYHLDTVEAAKLAERNSVILEQEQYSRRRGEIIRAEVNEEKKVLESALEVERKRTKKLEKLLLIDHDLERLLQSKPDWIIKIINTGTEKYYVELREETK